jgi:hypothetical protein
MTPDLDSLFTPRPRDEDGTPGDPTATVDGRAWRWTLPGSDNPTGWRLAAVWAVGSLVVVATGLVLAALLGTGPPGLAKDIARVIVFPPGGGQQSADPAPPAAPVPGETYPTTRDTTVVPGRLPSSRYASSPAYPSYPAVPGVPPPPAPAPGSLTAGPEQPAPRPGTSLPVPTEPTTPAQPTTVEPTVPAAEPTVPTEEPTVPTEEPTVPTDPDPTGTTEPAEPTASGETTSEPTAEDPPTGSPGQLAPDFADGTDESPASP